MNGQLSLIDVLVLGAFLVALLASAWSWIGIANRWLQGRPEVAYEPRQTIPWRGWDVLLVILVYWGSVRVALQIVGLMLGPEATKPLNKAADAGALHPLTHLIRSGSAAMVVLGVLLAVVLAPLVEEFLFRVLLQGWLEAAWRRWRRALRVQPRLGCAGPARPRLLAAVLQAVSPTVGPVLLASLAFAAMHFRRTNAPQFSAAYWAGMFVAQSAAGLATAIVAVIWLKVRTGATAADLGCAPEKLLADVRLGLSAAMAVIPPLLLLQVDLNWALEHCRSLTVAPDPIPVFFLALVLGRLYQRTHRIIPSLVLHSTLNATSVAIFFLDVSAKR